MDFSKISMKGKVALVSGASRGIGEASALAFAGAGADVVVASRKLSDLEEWAGDTTFNVNLRGPFFLAQLVARVMKEQGGGCMINTASVGGLRASELNIYSVTKAAYIMLTQVMAKEWGQWGIRVNAIAPGLIKTRLAEALWKEPAASEAAVAGIALLRLGEPDDVAGAVLFLASDLAKYVTGETIVVDGGQLLGPPSYRERKGKRVAE